MAGGKSRKTGGVSKKLIQRLIQERERKGGAGNSGCCRPKVQNKIPGLGLLSGGGGKEDGREGLPGDTGNDED